MSKIDRRELIQKYKHLLVPINENGPNYSINLFGIEHGNGWNNVTRHLFERFDFHLKHNALIKNSDFDETLPYDKDDIRTKMYIPDPEAYIHIHQIKEKFARYEVYFIAYPDKLYECCENTVSYCNALADTQCEICGRRENSDGSYIKITKGWLIRMCDRCAILEKREFPEENEIYF